MVKFESKIEWPDGEGYTPCSFEYKQVYMESKIAEEKIQDLATIAPGNELVKLINSFNKVRDKLTKLTAEGHVGKDVRY